MRPWRSAFRAIAAGLALGLAATGCSPEAKPAQAPEAGSSARAESSAAARAKAAAAPDTPGEQRPVARDIVLVVIDTLRADHLGAYGYPVPTSPHFDALAQSATLYSRAVSSGAWTLPSHASMFTGLDPHEHGAISYLVQHWGRGNDFNAHPLSPEHTTLAERLSAGGYETGAFVANVGVVSRETGLLQGFDEIGMYYVRARQLNQPLRAFISAERAAPFFLFVNYMDSHRPYNTQPLKQTNHPAASRDANLIARFTAQTQKGEPHDGTLVTQLIAQYDNGIMHADRGLGRIIAMLKRTGRYEDALIIVTSDHGEYFGEHDLVEHAKDIYQPVLRIPLLIKAPRQRIARRVDSPVSSAHLPNLIGRAMGGKLGEQLERDFPRRPEQHPVIIENYYSRPPDIVLPGWKGRFKRIRRALIDWPYKFIQSSDGQHELYDLSRDPQESRNLAAGEPQHAATMLLRLERDHPRADPVPPATVQKIAPERLEALKELGYTE